MADEKRKSKQQTKECNCPFKGAPKEVHTYWCNVNNK
jgi:hypothetical protein